MRTTSRKGGGRWLSLAALLLVLVLVLSCAPRVVEVQRQASVDRGQPAQPVEAPAEAPAMGARDEAYRSEQSAVAQRMIITTVTMSMLVEDTDEALQSIKDLLASHQGYIAESQKWYIDEQPYANITLRIPAQSLDAALGQIRALAIRVTSENVSGQDVTEEYTDLQSRLRNLEATEKELLALLTEVRENRSKAEDILAIYRELNTIRGEIETLKGREQYLERMTALATVQIEIRPKEAPASVLEPSSWSPLVTLSRALRALVSVAKVLADVAIYVITLSPIVIIPALVLWLLVRLLRRRKASKQDTAA